MGNVNKIPNNEYKKILHTNVITKYNELLPDIPSKLKLNDRVYDFIDYVFNPENDTYDGDDKLFYDISKNTPLLIRHALKLMIISKHHDILINKMINVFLLYHTQDIIHYHIKNYNIIDFMIQYQNSFMTREIVSLLNEPYYIHRDSIEYIIYNSYYMIIPILVKHEMMITDGNHTLMNTILSNITTSQFVNYNKEVHMLIKRIFQEYDCKDKSFYHLCKNKKIKIVYKVDLFQLYDIRVTWKKNIIEKTVHYVLNHGYVPLYDHIFIHHRKWHDMYYDKKHIQHHKTDHPIISYLESKYIVTAS